MFSHEAEQDARSDRVSTSRCRLGGGEVIGRFWALSIGVMIAAGGVSAATVTWDGEGDGQRWHDPLNWSGNALPAATDDVVLAPPEGASVVFAGSDAAIRRLDVRGVLRLASGHLDVGETATVSGTMELAGGRFSAAGGLSAVGGALHYLGGVVEGPVTVRNGALELGPSGEAAATFLLQGTCSLSGFVHANQTVRVQGSVTHGRALVTAPVGMTNQGTIRLECASNDYADRSVTLAVSSGWLRNEPGGRIEVSAANGEARSIQGAVRNEGTVSIESGITLVVNGSDRTFTQASGEILALGGFRLEGGDFDWTGGSLQGAVRVYNARVSVGDGLSQASTLRLVGAGNRLVENLSPLATLWVEGTMDWGAATLTAETGAENRGIIHLETSSNDWRDLGSRLDGGADGLLNAASGVIETVAGAGDARDITGRLVNRGRVEAGTETIFTGTLEAAGGAFMGPLRVKDSDVFVTGSPDEPTLINLVGANNRLLSDNFARTTLWVEGNVHYGPARLIMPTGVMNHGVIRLETTSNDWRDLGAYLQTQTGSLANGVDGTVDVRLGAGDRRVIEGNVVNEGSIVTEPGVTLEVTGVAPVFVQSKGQIDAQGAFLLDAGRFDLLGGVLKGTVRVLNTTVLVGDGLAEASTLRLVGADNKLVGNRSTGGTLWIEGTITWGSAKLTAEPGAENRGIIHLETSSNDAWDRASRLDCGPDGLLNAPGALISSASGSGDPRVITGRLVNRGRVEAGIETLFTGTLEAAGGTFTGPFRVKDSDLFITGSPAEPTLIDLIGPNNRLLSDNLARTILWVEGNVNYGSARLLMPTGVMNHGVLRLEATQNDAWERGSFLEVQTGSLTNAIDGIIDVRAGHGDRRVLEGNVVNEGSILIESDTSLEVIGTAPVFVQTTGQIDARGAFLLSSGRFDLLGGVLKGTVRVLNTAVLIGDGLGDASTLRLVGAENKLLANRSVMATLWIEGTVNWGAAKLTVEPGAENRGIIHLETSSNDAWDRGSRMDCGVAGLVNAAGGVIRAVAGAGDQRQITGRVVNRGRIEAEAETEFVGTLDAAGGICLGALLIHDSDLLVTGSPPEPTSLLLEGGANRLLTGNLPNTELWLRGNTRFGTAVLTAMGSVTNEGVIRLDTTSIDYRQLGSQLVLGTGVLHNGPGGTLRLAAGVGGPRTVAAALVNDGTVEFDIAGSVGSSRARHVNRGTLRLNGVTATFSGMTFENESAGRITGDGTLNVSGLRCSNAGTIAPGAPIGVLSLTGTLVQNPAGVVEIELAGSESGPVHDRLAVSGAAYLEGLLRLERLEGFVPELGSSFAVVTHAAPYGRFRQVEGTAVGDELRFDVTYQPTQVLIETVSASSTNEQAPTIVRQPANQEVVQGRPAWFGVTVNGATPLDYQWQLNEVDLPGATDSVLHLPAVSSADAGAYRVLVENAYGSVTSVPASLVVQQSIGTFVALAEAGATELPVVPGDGVRIEVFNGVGGGQAPAPAHLDGIEPDGTTLSPFIDFPRPGATVAVGTSFNRFFAETTTPPEQVSGLSAANFILRHGFYLRISRDLDLDPDTPAIDVQLGVGSDDGFHLAVGSVFIGSAGDRGFAYTYRTVSFEEAGLYPVTLLFAANAAGSSGLEFGWETAMHGTVIVPQAVLYRSPTPGQHLITFEEQPAGTVVSSQFAGEGILFQTVSGNLQVTADRPEEFVPVSAPHVYADPALDAAAPVEIELRFVEPATGRPATVDFLSFFVIDAEETGAVVTAFDPKGAEVFRQAYHGGGAAQEEV
ncbi:MAG TPA: immunoglobulin domain-containing protein, partial [Candidatus Paceibacterota bacterium]|nr:immunoglobulin domain-containing protein [Candidatus Paceibacterota bacterium]